MRWSGSFRQFEGKGEAELIGEFTSEFPWRVIATLIGMPPDKREECGAAGTGAQKQITDPDAATVAAAAFKNISQKIIDDHRVNPADDLTTMLLNTEVNGEKQDLLVAHADLNTLLEYQHLEFDPTQITPLNKCFDRFGKMSKISIAQIEGQACGGGSEMALAMDLRFGAIGKD